MSKLKIRSVGLYTEGLNNGTEYALREDGSVFVREKTWNGRFYATSKWIRDSFWDKTFKHMPTKVMVGFGARGSHFLVPNTRLRLPQD